MVREKPSATTIESAPAHGPDPLIPQLARLGPFGRGIVALALLTVAVLLLLAALVLSAVNSWVAAAVILLALEPLAVFCACGALYCIVPTSAMGRWFGLVLRRTKPVLVVVLIILAAASASGLAVAAWIWFTSE